MSAHVASAARTLRTRSGRKSGPMRLLVMLLATVVLALSLAFVSAGPAAATTEGGSGGGTRGVCDTSGTSDSSGLPVSRWAGGTDQFHSRLGTKVWNDVAEKIQRQGVMTVMFAVGNTAWTTTTGLVETAINFCILDKIGGAVDSAGAKIGDAILGSGLIALAVVGSLFVYVWRIGRSQGGLGANVGGLVQKGLIVGLFGILLIGASASTGGGADGSNAPYDPGKGSPGWFITSIDNIVAESANTLAWSLDNTEVVSGAEEGYSSSRKGNENLGCAPYVKAMKDIYKSKYSAYGGTDASATTPLMLSAMWERSGLELWKRSQFGDRNPYGEYAYCRVLEYNADAPVTEGEGETSEVSVEELMKEAGATKVGFGDNDSITIDFDRANLAFQNSSSVTIRDRAWVAWAACAAPRDGTELLHEDNGGDLGQLNEQCNNFFTQNEWDGGNGGGEFDWDDSNDDITETPTTPEVQDFLLSLHGNKNLAGLVSGFVYMISSFMIAIVFVVFALAVLVAKVAALLFMIGIFFTLLISLLPSMSAAKIGDYAKQYLGLSLFAWGAQLLLSVMALITTILVDVGGDVVPDGPGGIMGILWTGFAPIIAAICLHMMFKKMRVPSPMKPSAGMAWGQMAAGGAIGAGAMAGGTALGNRLANRAKRESVRRGKQAGSALVGKDRRSKMAPGGRGPKERDPSTSDTTESAVDALGDDATEAERATAARDDKAERAAAAAFAGTEEGKAALADVEAERSRGAAAHVKDRMRLVAEQFRDKPFATTAKVAAVGALGAATGGIGGIAAAGAIGGIAAATGTSGVQKSARSANFLGSAQRMVKSGDQVEAYRRHQAAQRQQQAPETQPDSGGASRPPAPVPVPALDANGASGGGRSEAPPTTNGGGRRQPALDPSGNSTSGSRSQAQSSMDNDRTPEPTGAPGT